MKEFEELVWENFGKYDRRAWFNTVKPLAVTLDQKFAEIEAKLEALKNEPDKYFDEAQGEIVNTTSRHDVTMDDVVDLKRGDHNHLVTYYTAMDCSEMIKVSAHIWKGEAAKDMVHIEFDPYNKGTYGCRMWDAEDWVLSLDDPSEEQVSELMKEYNHVKTQYSGDFEGFLLDVRDCVRDVKLFIEKYNS